MEAGDRGVADVMLGSNIKHVIATTQHLGMGESLAKDRAHLDLYVTTGTVGVSVLITPI